MQISKGGLVILITLIGGIGMARAQDAIDQLQPLVETSARRLELAKQVALAKWDSQLPVEDAARDEQVLTEAVKDGKSKGLDQTFVSHFFAAQIEANKLVQYSLLANWRRVGLAPAHQPVNLTTMIRPQLDQLQRDLVQELAATAAIRAKSTCREDTAKAIQKYLVAHNQDTGPLKAIALDRAMAATCP